MAHGATLQCHPAFTKRPLVLTMGDPAGVGGDISLKAWVRRYSLNLPPFVLLDDPERLRQLACARGFDVPVKSVDTLERGAVAFSRALPVLPLSAPVFSRLGTPDPKNAPAILESIQRGFLLTRSGQASALVTNPVHKKNLSHDGPLFTGHTDYLARLANLSEPPVMMMASEIFRVVPVTVHIPISAVARTLSTERIFACGMTVYDALQRQFGVASPRLAISGLNPHAGEGGVMGCEERDHIIPAIERLRRRGIRVEGPWPADTLFCENARQAYDVALCMYHDQALIPFKTLTFHKGANVTLGLPIVRASPDHGTAYDIAGSGKACEDSLVVALKTAAHMALSQCATV